MSVGVIAVAIAAAASAAMVWWATGPWGAGLTADAIPYVAIAEGIRHGELGYWLEPHLTTWPPFFSAVLAAVATVTGGSAADAGRVVNSLAQGATVVLAAMLARRVLANSVLRAVAIGFAAIGLPVVYAAVRVWSEPLFDVIVLAAMLLLAGAHGRHSSAKLAGAGILIALGFATRYAGMAFVPAGVVALVVWPRPLPLATRLRAAATFGIPAAAGTASLVAWNLSRAGNIFGPRWRPTEPFWNHLLDGLAVIGQWFLPPDTTRSITVVGGLLVVAAAGFALVRATRSTGSDAPANTALPANTRASGAQPVLSLVIVLSVFLGCYLAYMVGARTTSGFSRLYSRLMLPVFVPSVLLALAFFDHWIRRARNDLARCAAIAVPGLLLVPAAAGGIDELRTSHDLGTEYTSAAVREVLASPVVQGIPHDCDLLANDPWLLWLAGREAQITPENSRELAIPASMELSQLAPLVASTSQCLVWFDIGSTVFFTPDQLAAEVDLTKVAGDHFTTVYRLRPRS